MKLTKITLIAIIVISAIMLTGCQEEQLAQCQLENTELMTQMQEQAEALSKNRKAQLHSAKLITEVLIKNGELKQEIAALKETIAELKQTQSQAVVQTPEQKEIIRKGLEQLFELQRKSAEKLQKEAQKETQK